LESNDFVHKSRCTYPDQTLKQLLTRTHKVLAYLFLAHECPNPLCTIVVLSVGLRRVCKFSSNSLVSNVYHQMCTFFGVAGAFGHHGQGQEGQAIKPACQRQRYVTLLARGGAQCAAQYVCFAGWQLASLRSSPPHFRAFELSALATRWLANAHTHTHTHTTFPQRRARFTPFEPTPSCRLSVADLHREDVM